LVRLQDTPAVILPETDSYSAFDTQEYALHVEALIKYRDYAQKTGENPFTNPWRGTSIDMVTYERMAEISKVTEALLSALPALGGEGDGTIGGLLALSEGICEYADLYAGGRQYVSPVFREGMRADLAERYLSGIRDVYAQAGECGIRAEDIQHPDRRRRLHALLGNAYAEANGISTFIEQTARDCGQTIPYTAEGIRKIGAIARMLQVPFAMRAEWFGEGVYEKLLSLVRVRKMRVGIVNGSREDLLAEWKEEFLGFDGGEILMRFESTSSSFLRRLRGGYRRDRALLLSMRKPGTPSDDRSLIAGLRALTAYREEVSGLVHTEEQCAELLGGYYLGENTDWNHVEEVLCAAKPAQEYAARYGLSEILAAEIGLEAKKRTIRIGGYIPGEILEGGLLPRYELAAERIGISVAERTRTLYRQIMNGPAAAGRAADAVSRSLRVPEEDLSVIGQMLHTYLEEEKAFEARREKLRGSLMRLSCGTGQESLRGGGSPAYAKSAEKTEQELLQVGERLSEMLRGAGFRAEDETGSVQNEKPYNMIRSFTGTIRKFFGWFPQEDLKGLSVGDFSEKVRQCGDIEKLYSWLSFEDTWEMCERAGVSGLIDACIGQGIDPERYVDVFKKSFYTKWLFGLLSGEDARQLRNFRSHVHEAMIDRFAEDDADSLRIARERLGEILTHRKPAGGASVRKGSEMAILRHEANKKRSIKPIRRLLREIPNLVMSLKPCLMMSPLSAAYFLDPDQYTFDMVIFDEASQILPEDAIGAIFRGRQVIITGDTKQMPPTSFFTTAVRGTEDFDRDEEEFPDEPVSESVLDEAAAWLPSCMLLWHYRSRDESLIAFSNREIYKNRLITFPGCGRQPDRGIEYVLVENGIYRDRSNFAEAEKCVELIREHILRHPERSLGVVAFSEKQQSVIEDAVGRFRLQNPEYEEFFDEEREEPFFVKNLENVQGDERDTILFSICYAKNEQGKMYLRFGPLGAAGGERRLNVAITRAKYNVKLVGSILPEDIDLRRTQAEGVRMLRDYIAYAMAGGTELSAGKETSEEGSFEDAVADFIRQQGYTVRRNVGASRCRVDIAVGENGAENSFFAGIECDGDSYTMGRTVRERDVLKKAMLTSMGWRMHHVWSFNWFRMPEEEKARLVDFLEEAKNAGGESV
ncbi:MAG: hypothetical protein J6D46_01740, partial [Lachnospiraceae bacterium]|nr:hypothetical protein [Lachnospiraceae bacterium]